MSDKFSINIDDTEREIFMSFALVSELASVVGGPENIGHMHLDPVMRDTTLILLLSERSKGGRVTKELENIGDVEASINDLENLLDWASQHVLDFFLRSIQRGTKIANNNKEKMEQLASTLSGLAGSASKTPSSGASKSDPAP